MKLHSKSHLITNSSEVVWFYQPDTKGIESITKTMIETLSEDSIDDFNIEFKETCFYEQEHSFMFGCELLDCPYDYEDIDDCDTKSTQIWDVIITNKDNKQFILTDFLTKYGFIEYYDNDEINIGIYEEGIDFLIDFLNIPDNLYIEYKDFKGYQVIDKITEEVIFNLNEDFFESILVPEGGYNG